MGLSISYQPNKATIFSSSPHDAVTVGEVNCRGMRAAAGFLYSPLSIPWTDGEGKRPPASYIIPRPSHQCPNDCTSSLAIVHVLRHLCTHAACPTNPGHCLRALPRQLLREYIRTRSEGCTCICWFVICYHSIQVSFYGCVNCIADTMCTWVQWGCLTKCVIADIYVTNWWLIIPTVALFLLQQRLK